jgi:hypothetical protein
MAAKLATIENKEPAKSSDSESTGFRFAKLVQQADKDSRKLPALKEFMALHPDICEKVWILAGSVREALISKLASGAGSQEMIAGEYSAFVKRLDSENADPLERLLITRIAMCWLRLLWAEHYNASFMRGGVNMRESEYADKLLSRAHTRFIRACESLARTRKLTRGKSNQAGATQRLINSVSARGKENDDDSPAA